MAERIEYFQQEKEIHAQKERDARLLIMIPGRLAEEAEKIATAKWESMEKRKLLDFV